MRLSWVNLLRYGLALVVLLAGVTLSVYTGHLVREWHRSMVAASFSHLMELYVNAVDASLSRMTENLRALGDYVEVTGALQAKEFDLYTSSLLRRYPELDHVLWVPRLTAAQLRELGSLSAVTRSQDGEASAADTLASDAAVWPVQTVRPDNESGDWRGLNARRHPLFRDLLAKAGQDGDPASSYAFARNGGDQRDGFMIAVNVPGPIEVRGASGAVVTAGGGFIVGLVTIPTLIQRALNDFASGFIQLYLLDSDRRLIGRYGVGKPPAEWGPGEDLAPHLESSPVRTQNLAVADREWRLVGIPGESFAPPRSPREADALVVAGSLFSLLLALYLATLTGALSRRRRAMRELRSAAKYDGLTGLATRTEFFRELRGEWERAIRYGHALSVIMLDLDHFKTVNDQYGHPAGDAVLRALGGVLAKSVRAEDKAARYGGEEFILMLVETDAARARRSAERIQAEIGRMRVRVSGDAQIGVTATLGLASRTPDLDSLHDLIRRADRALYDGKYAGRDGIREFETAYARPTRASNESQSSVNRSE